MATRKPRKVNAETGKETRVYWTDKEEHRLLTEAARLAAADESRLFNLAAFARLLDVTQRKILPENRWRSFKASSSRGGRIGSMYEETKRRVESLRLKPGAKQPPRSLAIEPAPAQVTAPPPPAPMEPAPAPEIDVAAVLAELTLPELLAHTIDRIVRVGAAEVGAAMAAKMDEMTAPSADAVPRPRSLPSLVAAKNGNRLPRIVVAGLLAEQQGVLVAKYGERARLQFVDKNRSGFNAFPDKVDFCVLPIRFISHAIQEAAKQRYGTERIIRSGGAIGQVGKAVEVAISRAMASQAA